jgi:hypothetical protein
MLVTAARNDSSLGKDLSESCSRPDFSKYTLDRRQEEAYGLAIDFDGMHVCGPQKLKLKGESTRNTTQKDSHRVFSR